MTAPTQPTDLAHVAWLEQLIKPGYSLIHTRHSWYFARWGSLIDEHDSPRMDWLEVDSDPRLEALLGRMEAR